MAKKRTNNEGIPQWVRDLYREDIERVARGERPMYFGSLSDAPIGNIYPEFDVMTGMRGRSAGTKIRSGITMEDINKGIGKAIRDFGNTLGPFGPVWRGLYDMASRVPDKGLAGLTYGPLGFLNREENRRRIANGDYPIGYVHPIYMLWNPEKYGTAWDKRTDEEVRQWEIEHGTRPAAEVELPNVDVYPRDSMDDGGDIAASFLLPNVDVYPQDRFGDIARSQGIETARAWRDVRNAVSEGRNEFMNDPRTQIVTSLLPIPAGVEGADVVLPYLQRFGNRFRSLMAGLSLRGNPSSQSITEKIAETAVQREFKRRPDLVFRPNERPTVVNVKEVDGKWQRLVEETDLPDFIDDKNLVDITDGFYAYKNPKSRKGLVKNGKKIDHVSVVYPRVDEDGNVWLKVEGKNYNIGRYESYNPERKYVHMDYSSTGKNDKSKAHFDENGRFMPGKSDNESDYIWWEENAPFYNISDRIIEINADGVPAKNARAITGFGNSTSVITDGMDLRSMNPNILEMEPTTGYFSRVRLKKKGGRVYEWTDKDERDFQDWYARVSEHKGLNPDPDDGNQYYDYRTFWKENPDGMADKMLTDDADAYFTDRYKLPGHPTFSNESMYSNDETPGGSWEIHEGKWYFSPSDYTRTYLDRTLNYLAGDKENGIYLDGEYRLVPRMDGGGQVKVRGLSATIDTGARPIYTGDNYVYDPRQDYENSEAAEMERLRDIYDYLRNNKKHKFSEVQALAITANIAAESRGKIDALGKAGDFGLQQWLGARKKELQKRYGKRPTMEQQLDYLIDEYSGNVSGLGWNFVNRGRYYGSDNAGNEYNYYMYSKNDFDNATSYLDATVAWNQGFGRPLGSTLRNDARLGYARKLAEAWGIEDGEYQGYSYGMRKDDGSYEHEIEMTPPPVVKPVQTPVGRVDSWRERNGDAFVSSMLANAGATREMVEGMKADIAADEESKREMARQQAEVDRENLKKQIAMSLISGISLNILGMARSGQS